MLSIRLFWFDACCFYQFSMRCGIAAVPSHAHCSAISHVAPAYAKIPCQPNAHQQA